MSKQNKTWPSLPTDEAAKEFVANSDLSEFNWNAAEPVNYEIEDKSARVNMRLPESQLAEIKAEAERRGVKYQRFMRELMDRGMQTLHR